MAAEIKLIESLKFELRVFHPLNCMNSLLADWKLGSMKAPTTTDGAVDEDHSKRLSALVVEWQLRAHEVLSDLQVTSAVLSYTPMALAVCALLMTDCEELRVLAVSGREDLDMQVLTDYMKQLKATNTWPKRLPKKKKEVEVVSVNVVEQNTLVVDKMEVEA
eukprot:gene22574-28707_t